ncbi:unnamed protein product [Calicophoron daubneyi]|uniref:Signal transducing adapter molecule 1 n=1 Tax=Calicophoron daubneyi TaxID=300641 RepID=A0AAV2TD75_CALDB
MEALIEQCTSEKNTQDKWDLILRVCEEYGEKESKACLKCITKRIFHKNPNVSLRAVTLLDACSKNCGKAFNREVSSRDFSQTVKNKFASLQRIPSLKLVEIFEKWAQEFKNDSELALAASLYNWVKTEHPNVIRNLAETRQINKAGQARQNAAQIQAKEVEELAKAIALSLKESEAKPTVDANRPRPSTTTAQATSSDKLGLYPNFQASGGPKISNAPSKGMVRALYDFEAAEDNELTFKTGELIVLLDDSDENWWRGSNHRGEGLFPAQFVKREDDEGVESVTKKDLPNNTPNHAGAKAKADDVPKTPVQLDAGKIDECLRLINLADPTGEYRFDPPELNQLEAECNAMAPLVDPELEKVDKRILMLSDLNQRLLDAFQLYHDLMSRSTLPPPYFSTIQSTNPGVFQGPSSYIPSSVGPYPPPQQVMTTGGIPLAYGAAACGPETSQIQAGPVGVSGPIASTSTYPPPDNMYPNQPAMNMHYATTNAASIAQPGTQQPVPPSYYTVAPQSTDPNTNMHSAQQQHYAVSDVYAGPAYPSASQPQNPVKPDLELPDTGKSNYGVGVGQAIPGQNQFFYEYPQNPDGAQFTQPGQGPTTAMMAPSNNPMG